jgi:hypothetical protein
MGLHAPEQPFKSPPEDRLNGGRRRQCLRVLMSGGFPKDIEIDLAAFIHVFPV